MYELIKKYWLLIIALAVAAYFLIIKSSTRKTPTEILDEAAAVLKADENTTKIDTVTRTLWNYEWTPKILALQAKGMSDADIVKKIIAEDY